MVFFRMLGDVSERAKRWKNCAERGSKQQKFDRLKVVLTARGGVKVSAILYALVQAGSADL